MELKTLKSMMEEPIYSSLDEVFDKADLTEVEREAFVRNKSYCEYWLLRSKRGYHRSFDSEETNFIKRLARVINCLESDLVSGDKKQKIKELFGVGQPVHRVYKTKNGCRSTQNSPILENTYFELVILSFFVERGYNVELVKSSEPGKRIPKFIVSLNSSKLSVEAKKVNVDSIMDNIFGDSFIDGIDHCRSQAEQEKGYKRIKSQIEKRYEDAMDKYKHINPSEQYIIFMSVYYNNSHIGIPAINFLNSLQSHWADQELNGFAGLVIPEDKQTIFIQNNQCSKDLLHELSSLRIEDFHNYVP